MDREIQCWNRVLRAIPWPLYRVIIGSGDKGSVKVRVSKLGLLAFPLLPLKRSNRTCSTFRTTVWINLEVDMTVHLLRDLEVTGLPHLRDGRPWLLLPTLDYASHISFKNVSLLLSRYHSISTFSASLLAHSDLPHNLFAASTITWLLSSSFCWYLSSSAVATLYLFG